METVNQQLKLCVVSSVVLVDWFGSTGDIVVAEVSVGAEVINQHITTVRNIDACFNIIFDVGFRRRTEGSHMGSIDPTQR